MLKVACPVVRVTLMWMFVIG